MLWLCGALTAIALEPTTPLAEYGRQSWVMENGLPQNTVHALAQTTDGYLWLATESGLARFDGYAFSVFDTTSTPSLPSSDIRCLLATRDGALWVGTSSGLARMKDGVATIFTTAKGLPGNQVQALAEDARGFVIVTTDNGMVGIEGEQITPLYLDRLESADGALNPVMSATAANGEHAQATTSTVTLMQGKKEMSWSVGRELPGSRMQALFFDREGSLWIGTNGGLVRFARGKLDKLPVTDPLSSASILALCEDREGNLWVGTETGGVHIFRDERFRNIGTREGLSSDNTTTVVEDSAGTLWVGTSGSGLDALPRAGSTPEKTSTYTVRNGLLSDVVLSLAAAPNGDIWAGTPDGLNLIRRGRVNSFTSADGLPDDFVRSLLVDTDGSLWIGTRRGLTHWMNAPSGKHMQTFTQASGLGSDLVGAMVRDRRGSLWVATLAGLSRLEGGKITNYTTANGLSSDVVTALLPRSEGALLIGTQDHGWNLWDGERFSSPKDSRLDETSIHAILDDAGNHLWFATGNGIARCDCTMTADCTHWVEFGPADGLRSRETAINSHPSAWRSRDGHLWFATPKGLLEADPAHFPINMNPPPVAVERFAVDDVDQPLHKADVVRIPAGHGHFAFDYAGLSFTAPQKVRYRYMLEGFDHEWTNAGARRTAYYTNIPPGQYTFRVQAANNDGLWNLKGAALQFELRPHFYQTIWFYILLTAVVAGMVVVLLKRRLMRAEREFGAVLGERNRIAREIHDTLAQGYVGISVQLEVLSELLRHNKVDAAQKQLDATRGHVREGLADARQSIWALRSQDSGEKTLPVTLRRVTENSDGHGIEASFSVYGAYRPLPPGTEREFLRVAQEAIHNVKKHAGAKHLFVQMEYGQSEVALEVRDDGCGFAMDGNSGSAPGHYGMTGMRERAAAVGGRLEVTSVPGE
ncbi:MAG TPA: two-component regulator propeller domain-containing protein, partial [Terracidiphilus sp.]|nr:two-component regulator propeller domain-containing protein [Terracidiphilus sp.]